MLNPQYSRFEVISSVVALVVFVAIVGKPPSDQRHLLLISRSLLAPVSAVGAFYAWGIVEGIVEQQKAGLRAKGV